MSEHLRWSASLLCYPPIQPLLHESSLSFRNFTQKSTICIPLQKQIKVQLLQSGNSWFGSLNEFIEREHITIDVRKSGLTATLNGSDALLLLPLHNILY